MSVTFNDPHMISDEALDARFTDEQVLGRLFDHPRTGALMRSLWNDIERLTPQKVPQMLLNAKKELYRETMEYIQATRQSKTLH